MGDRRIPRHQIGNPDLTAWAAHRRVVKLLWRFTHSFLAVALKIGQTIAELHYERELDQGA